MYVMLCYVVCYVVATLNTVSQFMIGELKELDLTDYTYTNYRKTAVLSLARLTLYNRRRSHEVQAVT